MAGCDRLIFHRAIPPAKRRHQGCDGSPFGKPSTAIRVLTIQCGNRRRERNEPVSRAIPNATKFAALTEPGRIVFKNAANQETIIPISFRGLSQALAAPAEEP